MQDIKKSRMPRLTFGPTGEEWKTMESDQQGLVMKALSNPISWRIYDELGKGAVRQSELARRVSKVVGKKVTNALARYHLARLARAGLVQFGVDPESRGRVKMVSRAADVRVQMRAGTGQIITEERAPPATHEEMSSEIKQIFKTSPKPLEGKAGKRA